MDKEKLLTEMTVALQNNRGLAERALKIFVSNNLAGHIDENRDDIEDADSEGTLRDYFCDLVYNEWTEDHKVAYFIDILCGLNEVSGQIMGIGYLADLMIMYYRNR